MWGLMEWRERILLTSYFDNDIDFISLCPGWCVDNSSPITIVYIQFEMLRYDF